MTRERIGRFCIILGGLCILAAAFLLGFNLREERRAAAATQRILLPWHIASDSLQRRCLPCPPES